MKSIKLKVFIHSLILIICLSVISGCNKELSITPNISIKQSNHRHVLYSGSHRYEGVSIPDVLQWKNRTVRVISSVDLSPKFDILIETEANTTTEAFEETFCLSIKKETRTIPVYVITTKQELSDDFRLSTDNSKQQRCDIYPIQTCKHLCRLGTYLDLFKTYEPTHYDFQNFTLKNLTFWLESYSDNVFVDETKLTGTYDFELINDEKKNISCLKSLMELGFKITRSERPVEAIFIDSSPDCLSNLKLKKIQSAHIVYPAWSQ